MTEYTDNVKLICDRCERTWFQKVKYFSAICWDCPKCGNQDRVSMLEYVQPESKEIDPLGKGGCGARR